MFFGSELITFFSFYVVDIFFNSNNDHGWMDGEVKPLSHGHDATTRTFPSSIPPSLNKQRQTCVNQRNFIIFLHCQFIHKLSPQQVHYFTNREEPTLGYS